MKRVFLYFSLVLWACEAAPQQSSQVPVVPQIEISFSKTAFTRKGALTLLNSLPYSGFIVDHYENGQLKSKTGYVDGLKQGIAIQYYDNGLQREKRFYLNNRKHGRHQGWWANGKSKFDYTFENGLQQGPSKEWHENGQAYRFFTYVDGQENGSQKMWESDGKIRANYVVKNGHRYGLIGLKNCKSVSDEKGVFTARTY